MPTPSSISDAASARPCRSAPIRAPVPTVSFSPSIVMRVARCSPTMRGKNERPAGVGNEADLRERLDERRLAAANTMSQANARLAPAPAATPFTAQTTGFSSVRTAGSRSGCSRRARSRRGRASPPSFGIASARSCPAQKPRPAPVSSTARTVGSVRDSRTARPQLRGHRAV